MNSDTLPKAVTISSRSVSAALLTVITRLLVAEMYSTSGLPAPTLASVTMLTATSLKSGPAVAAVMVIAPSSVATEVCAASNVSPSSPSTRVASNSSRALMAVTSSPTVDVVSS